MKLNKFQKKNALSDVDIVVSVLKGDTNAYAHLVKRYESRIYSVFTRSLRSHAVAAELAQEVFLKAFEKLSQFSQDKVFSSWLYAIAINTLRDYWRKEGRNALCTEELEPSCPSPEKSVEEQVIGVSMMQALEQLPVLYREALLLRYRDDCSVKEVADSLELSLSAAKMRLKRGLEMVSAMVEIKNG